MNVRCGPMYRGGKREGIDGSKLKRDGKLFTDSQILYLQDLVSAGYTYGEISEHTENDPANLRTSIIRGLRRINKVVMVNNVVITKAELAAGAQSGPWHDQHEEK